MGSMIARRGAAALGLLLLTAVAASGAMAEVTLATEVNKVVSTLDGSGRVERQLVPVEEVVPGEELRYTITFSNESDMPVEPERIVIINPIPDGTVYVPGSAGGAGSVVEYSAEGETWTRTEPAGAASGGASSSGTQPAADNFTAEPADGAAPSEVRSLRWTYQQELPPGGSELVFFHVRMQ